MTTKKEGTPGTPAPASEGQPKTGTEGAQPSYVTKADLDTLVKSIEGKLNGFKGYVDDAITRGPRRSNDSGNPFQAGNIHDDAGEADWRQQMEQRARQIADEVFTEHQAAPKRAEVAKAFNLEPDQLKGMTIAALDKMLEKVAPADGNNTGQQPNPVKPTGARDGDGGRGLGAGGRTTDKNDIQAMADGEAPFDPKRASELMNIIRQS